MTPERFKQLTTGFVDDKTHLTDKECVEGWHFCPDWDFMLIHKSHPEFKRCLCSNELLNTQ